MKIWSFGVAELHTSLVFLRQTERARALANCVFYSCCGTSTGFGWCARSGESDGQAIYKSAFSSYRPWAANDVWWSSSWPIWVKPMPRLTRSKPICRTVPYMLLSLERLLRKSVIAGKSRPVVNRCWRSKAGVNWKGGGDFELAYAPPQFGKALSACELSRIKELRFPSDHGDAILVSGSRWMWCPLWQALPYVADLAFLDILELPGPESFECNSTQNRWYRRSSLHCPYTSSISWLTSSISVSLNLLILLL